MKPWKSRPAHCCCSWDDLHETNPNALGTETYLDAERQFASRMNALGHAPCIVQNITMPLQSSQDVCAFV